MGSEQFTYIGPYLKLDKKIIQKTTNSKIETCSNEQCNNHKLKINGNFCSICGSPKVDMNISKQVDVILSPFELLYKFGSDSMFGISENVILPNKRNNYSIKVDRDDSFVEKEINQDIKSILLKFKKDYLDFLNFLDDESVKYQIKFGVISYWY